MQMARDFGVPPWRLGDEMPALWAERWLADQEARGNSRPVELPGEIADQGGNVRRTRVI